MTEEKKPNILKLKLKPAGEQQNVVAKPVEQHHAKQPESVAVPELTYSQNRAREKVQEEERVAQAARAEQNEAKSASPTLRGIPQIVSPQPSTRPGMRTTTFQRRPYGSNSGSGERSDRPGFNPDRKFDPNRPRNFAPRQDYDPNRPRTFTPRQDYDPNRPRTFTPRPGFDPNRPRQFGPRQDYDPNRPRTFTPRSQDERQGGGYRSNYNRGPRPEGGNNPRFQPRVGYSQDRRPQASKPNEFRSDYSRPQFGPTGGGYNPEFLQDTKRQFDADRARKKKTTEYDDKARQARGLRENEDVGINVTDFVGRIDSGHLESHMFRDAFIHRKKERAQKAEQVFIKREIAIAGPMSIKDIAAKMAMRSSQVLSVAKKAGLNASDKENVAEDLLHIIVEECGHIPIRIDEQNKAQLEFPVQSIDAAKSVLRPPVVVVVGHVDHGKTSLLDRIRKSNIAKREAGGITQNIGAYQVKTKEGTITFIDTPGHEAFTSMRSRGVQTTDIAILVVSSEESIKPQTIEAISHIKAAGVPIIVAITKCDLHTADIERVKTDLLSHEIIAEEFGGDVTCIPVSSVTGENIDKLLHTILLHAEMMELKANPELEARGIVLESKVNPKIGTVATLLVQQGTLKRMSFCIAHVSSGKIKAMHDADGNSVTEAGPGMPVEVIGLDTAPPAGAQFAQISNTKIASEILEARIVKNDLETKSVGLSLSFDTFVQDPSPHINLILRADTQGSLEALKLGLLKLNSAAAETKFVMSGVGAIRESDIDLAVISNAHIVGFNTKSNAAMKKLASDNKIKIIENEIIYHIIEEIEKELLGLIKPEEREVLMGTARVQQVFSSSKLGNIAGCVVTSGSMKNNMIAKVMRGEKLVATTKISSLKRNKDDAKEVNNGLECGIFLEGFDAFMAGDEIQCYKIELVS